MYLKCYILYKQISAMMNSKILFINILAEWERVDRGTYPINAQLNRSNVIKDI